MVTNFSTMVYLPAYDTFARAITVIPLASQPGELPYNARGIFDTTSLDVIAADNSIISEQRTILDIREAEFATPPKQHDQIEIPADGDLPEAGSFEIVDVTRNGGGEMTLTLHKIVATKP